MLDVLKLLKPFKQTDAKEKATREYFFKIGGHGAWPMGIPMKVRNISHYLNNIQVLKNERK